MNEQWKALIQKGYTTAAKLLASGMNVNSLRTNNVLRKEEWVQYDQAVVMAAQQRLVGVADLMSRGLVYRIGNGMGKTVLEYEDSSDFSDAEMSMDGMTRGKNDRLEYDLKYLPLPLVHKDWNLNIRALNASRNGGSPMDTSTAAMASRKVAEKLEKLLFNGSSSFTYGGGTIYGYLDATNRNTGTLTAAWSSATGDQILADVKAMKAASIAAKHYGPWMLYIPTAYETALDGDFKAASDKTIRQRLKEIAGIIDIKTADVMTAGNVVLVQMTDDVVRMVEALPLTNVEWETNGGMMTNYKVMTINVPQVRTGDQDGNSGVTHYAA